MLFYFFVFIIIYQNSKLLIKQILVRYIEIEWPKLLHFFLFKIEEI